MLIFLNNCKSVTFSTCSTKSRSLPQLTRYKPCPDLYKISDKEVHYKKRGFSGRWKKSQSCRSNQTWTWWKLPTHTAWYMWTVMDSDWGGGCALDLCPLTSSAAQGRGRFPETSRDRAPQETWHQWGEWVGQMDNTRQDICLAGAMEGMLNGGE